MSTDPRQEWETPPEFFAALDRYFNFDIDVCATRDNNKCFDYIAPEQDGLEAEWFTFKRAPMGRRSAFCNPGFSNLAPWIKQAASQVDEYPHSRAVLISHVGTAQAWSKLAFSLAKELWLPWPRVNYIPHPAVVAEMKAAGKKPSSNTKDTAVWIFDNRVTKAGLQIVPQWEWQNVAPDG